MAAQPRTCLGCLSIRGHGSLTQSATAFVQPESHRLRSLAACSSRMLARDRCRHGRGVLPAGGAGAKRRTVLRDRPSAPTVWLRVLPSASSRARRRPGATPGRRFLPACETGGWCCL
jgi:hypothetical protein